MNQAALRRRPPGRLRGSSAAAAGRGALGARRPTCQARGSAGARRMRRRSARAGRGPIDTLLGPGRASFCKRTERARGGAGAAALANARRAASGRACGGSAGGGGRGRGAPAAPPLPASPRRRRRVFRRREPLAGPRPPVAHKRAGVLAWHGPSGGWFCAAERPPPRARARASARRARAGGSARGREEERGRERGPRPGGRAGVCVPGLRTQRRFAAHKA